MPYQVLACGSNGSGQLGTGDTSDRSVLTAVEIPSRSPPAKFAFGGNHTLILCEDGSVYSCGDNHYGQCGTGNTQDLRSFTRVPGVWAHIAAGWAFSVLCTASGDIYTCGHGPRGELGLGPGVADSSVPARTSRPASVSNCSVSDVKASISHVLVRYSNGVYCGWGASRKGQLGPPEYVETRRGASKAVLLVWAPRICDFSAPNFCVGRDRSVFWGDGFFIAGNNLQRIQARPDTVKAMWSSVHYTEKTPHGLSIKSVGNNLHGQLFSYESPGRIVDFEVGSEHGVVLLDNNAVYAWGWGEHGNCGEDQREGGGEKEEREREEVGGTEKLSERGSEKLAVSEHGEHSSDETTHGGTHIAGAEATSSDSVTFNYLNRLYSGEHRVVHMACGLATTWLVVDM